MDEALLATAQSALRELADAWSAVTHGESSLPVIALHDVARALSPERADIARALRALDRFAPHCPTAHVARQLTATRATVAALLPDA